MTATVPVRGLARRRPRGSRCRIGSAIAGAARSLRCGAAARGERKPSIAALAQDRNSGPERGPVVAEPDQTDGGIGWSGIRLASSLRRGRHRRQAPGGGPGPKADRLEWSQVGVELSACDAKSRCHRANQRSDRPHHEHRRGRTQATASGRKHPTNDHVLAPSASGILRRAEGTEEGIMPAAIRDGRHHNRPLRASCRRR